MEDWDKFHKTVCEKWAGDEKRQMPGGGEQKKSLKKMVKAGDKKCTRPDCDNRGFGLFSCKNCKAVSKS